MSDETSGQDFGDINDALADFGDGADDGGGGPDGGGPGDAATGDAATGGLDGGELDGGELDGGELGGGELDDAELLDPELDQEQIDAIADAQQAMNEARERLAEVPAEIVVTNHVMGLYELAAIHLSSSPPDLAQSALAIDAVACLVDGLGDRLGAETATMRDALNNIRLAFVQIKSGVEGDADPNGA